MRAALDATKAWRGSYVTLCQGRFSLRLWWWLFVAQRVPAGTPWEGRKGATSQGRGWQGSWAGAGCAVCRVWWCGTGLDRVHSCAVPCPYPFSRARDKLSGWLILYPVGGWVCFRHTRLCRQTMACGEGPKEPFHTLSDHSRRRQLQQSPPAP